MTRRTLFLLAAAQLQATELPEDTPRNKMANAANSFNSAWSNWANAVNAMKPGSLDLGESEAFEPLEDLFRDVRRRRTDWIRGFK